LDFGLSFNHDIATEANQTPSAQQLGNRFLSLPELQVKGAGKRDPRSDLAQLSGILLYVLTGEHPVTLVDASNSLPHQRPHAAAVLDKLTSEDRIRLRRLFDVAFAVHIDQRFQTAEALRASLLGLTQLPVAQQTASVEQRLAALRESLSASAPLTTKENYRALLNQVNNILIKAVGSVRSQLGDRVTTRLGGLSIDMQSLRFANIHGLILAVDHSQGFCPTFEAMITGSELVVLGRHNQVEVELFRSPLIGHHEWNALESKAIGYLVDGVTEQLGRM
jgi:serine/threonine-protein kinase